MFFTEKINGEITQITHKPRKPCLNWIFYNTDLCTYSVHSDRQTYKQTDRHEGRHAGRQTDRHAGRHPDRAKAERKIKHASRGILTNWF